MVKQRFIDAAKGFGITLSAFLLVALMQMAFAADFVQSNGMIEEIGDRVSAIRLFRKAGVFFLFISMIPLLIYWLACSLFCRSPFLDVRGANSLIVMVFAIHFAHMVAISLLSPGIVPELKVICEPLNVSDSDAPWGFDTLSSCDIFAQRVYGHLFFSFPVAVLVISLAVRIVISRRSARSVRLDVAASPPVADTHAHP